MAIMDDQLKWRRVFSPEPDDFLVENSPDGSSEQPVVQTDAALLKCTNTPDGTNPQMVTQYTGVKGIWPVANAVLVNASAFQGGVGAAIIYTVPANKKLYLGSLSLAARENADADSYVVIAVRNAEDVYQFNLVVIYFVIAGQLAIPQSYTPAIAVEAGFDVYVSSAHANINGRGTIHGWLEDA